jgi:phenylalanyl-tRNA synthetase beta chain
MWGHRGVAREVAAMLNLPFKAIDHLLVPREVKEYEKKSTPGKEQTFTVAVENPASCRRFTGLYIEKIDAVASVPWMAARLAKVDSRPINAIVDSTNYVMLDISQPLHAFDAGHLTDKSIVVRNAKNKETITVLDGQTLELSADDCVITDGKKPIALAGIMGGKESGVSFSTQSIFLESANFDPAVIRKAALRLKKRTDSSARFEKDLDPHQTVIGIERFLQLITDAKIPMTVQDQIIAIGKTVMKKKVTVSHAYIEQQLGVSMDPQFVTQTLQKLEFAVENKNGAYQIVIPSLRATKDIGIKQDIVEEVGRFYGYDNIPEQLPARITAPFDLTAFNRTRRIKRLLASAWNMQEVYTYAFFDESFLHSLGWQPAATLKVQEAVSENWQRLVTTLVPNLLKVVHSHASEFDTMNFFEWAKIWPLGTPASEQSSLAGIFVNQKKSVDFYEVKQKMCAIAKMLGVHFDWVQAPPAELQSWYLPHQTAYLMCQGNKIGIAGKANPAMLSKIVTGDAFIFELDGNFLLTHHKEIKKYVPASKYPAITRDVSMLIPLSVTAKELREGLRAIDTKITAIDLVDFFHKTEWQDQKSVTFRITMMDHAATMTTAQADAIMHKVDAFLKEHKAVIR